jgi:hypothetical protein
MRKIYRASFRLLPRGEDVPTLEAVAAECLCWAVDRKGSTVAPEKIVEAAGADLERVEIGAGVVEALRAGESHRSTWALRLSHPDSQDPGLSWVSETTLATDDSNRGLRFAASVSVGRSDGRLSPTQRFPAGLRLVPTLLERWTGHVDRDLLTKARVLPYNQRTSYVDFLLSEQRRLPIVFLSVGEKSGRPLLSADDLARSLAGIAHVWVAEDRFTTRRLKEDIPEHLVCWNGAIRLYWPGFTRLAQPFQHPYWPPHRIEELEEKPGGFSSFLLNQLANAASHSTEAEALSWTTVERQRRLAGLEELTKQAGEHAALFELLSDENKDLAKRLEDTEAELDDLRQDLYKRDLEIEGLRETIRALQAGEQLTPATQVPVTSLDEAVRLAAARFSERLVIVPNSASFVEGNPFQSPEEALDALEFLATDYFENCTGVERHNLEMRLRERCGWRYRSSQSEVTISKYRRDYHVQRNGKRFSLGNHVGKGSGKDPRTTLRIAFAWDDEARKVVVGYIGQHQRNDST